jgi:hypothetical protein
LIAYTRFAKTEITLAKAVSEVKKWKFRAFFDPPRPLPEKCKLSLQFPLVF